MSITKPLTVFPASPLRQLLPRPLFDIMPKCVQRQLNHSHDIAIKNKRRGRLLACLVANDCEDEHTIAMLKLEKLDTDPILHTLHAGVEYDSYSDGEPTFDSGVNWWAFNKSTTTKQQLLDWLVENNIRATGPCRCSHCMSGRDCCGSMGTSSPDIIEGRHRWLIKQSWSLNV